MGWVGCYSLWLSYPYLGKTCLLGFQAHNSHGWQLYMGWQLYLSYRPSAQAKQTPLASPTWTGDLMRNSVSPLSLYFQLRSSQTRSDYWYMLVHHKFWWRHWHLLGSVEQSALHPKCVLITISLRTFECLVGLVEDLQLEIKAIISEEIFTRLCLGFHYIFN